MRPTRCPQRAIDDGLISRFGSLNPTDGGDQLAIEPVIQPGKEYRTDQSQFSAYVIRYKLDLYSTFTYYLKDPVYGDQMLQHDDRVVYGLRARRPGFHRSLGHAGRTVSSGCRRASTTFAMLQSIRLFSADHRYTSKTPSVVESSGAMYSENSMQWRPDVRTVLGVREDEFEFRCHGQDAESRRRHATSTATRSAA